MTQYTMSELLVCAQREITWRRRVYPGRVENRRMTAKQADAEISKMEAIAALLAELARKELLL